MTTAYLDHTRVFRFHGCASTPLETRLTLFRLMQVNEWTVYQRLSLVNVCWKHFEASQLRATLSNKDARAIQSHSYSQTSVFRAIDHVPVNIPTVLMQSNSSFQRQCGSDHMTSKGRSSNMRLVTRMFERGNLAKSIFMKYVRTSAQQADMLIEGAFTTMQWQSLLQLWQIQQCCDFSNVRNPSLKIVSCTALSALPKMAQPMTKAECIDKIVDRYSSNLLESSYAGARDPT